MMQHLLPLTRNMLKRGSGVVVGCRALRGMHQSELLGTRWVLMYVDFQMLIFKLASRIVNPTWAAWSAKRQLLKLPTRT